VRSALLTDPCLSFCCLQLLPIVALLCTVGYVAIMGRFRSNNAAGGGAGAKKGQPGTLQTNFSVERIDSGMLESPESPESPEAIAIQLASMSNKNKAAATGTGPIAAAGSKQPTGVHVSASAFPGPKAAAAAEPVDSATVQAISVPAEPPTPVKSEHFPPRRASQAASSAPAKRSQSVVQRPTADGQQPPLVPADAVPVSATAASSLPAAYAQHPIMRKASMQQHVLEQQQHQQPPLAAAVATSEQKPPLHRASSAEKKEAVRVSIPSGPY
jgi:hypothetical protein